LMVLTSATIAMMGNAIATRPRKTKNGSMDAPPARGIYVSPASAGRPLRRNPQAAPS
jgi:hypothetical protein